MKWYTPSPLSKNTDPPLTHAPSPTQAGGSTSSSSSISVSFLCTPLYLDFRALSRTPPTLLVIPPRLPVSRLFSFPLLSHLSSTSSPESTSDRTLSTPSNNRSCRSPQLRPLAEPAIALVVVTSLECFGAKGFKKEDCLRLLTRTRLATVRRYPRGESWEEQGFTCGFDRGLCVWRPTSLSSTSRVRIPQGFGRLCLPLYIVRF